MGFLSSAPGADPGGGGHVSHDPLLGAWGITGLPGAPPTRQGPTGLAGSPQNFQGTPHTCQGHHRPSRGTSQRHHSPFQGHQCTTGLSGAPVHHRPVWGTTGLAGVPQNFQGTPHTCQGHHGLAKKQKSLKKNNKKRTQNGAPLKSSGQNPLSFF